MPQKGRGRHGPASAQVYHSASFLRYLGDDIRAGGPGPAHPQARCPRPLRRGAWRHALGHFRAIYGFAVALARTLEHEQGANPEPAPDLSRVRDPAGPDKGHSDDRAPGHRTRNPARGSARDWGWRETESARAGRVASTRANPQHSGIGDRAVPDSSAGD